MNEHEKKDLAKSEETPKEESNRKAYKKPTMEKHERIYELGLGSP